MYQAECTSAHDKKIHFKFRGERAAWVGNFVLFSRRESYYLSRPILFPVSSTSTSDKNGMMKRDSFLGELEHPQARFLGNCSSLRPSNINLKQRSPARTNCFLSSDGFPRLQRRKLDSSGISDVPHDQTVYHLPIRTRANFKSEQYEVPETQLDSLNSSEMPSEAILIGANTTEVSPWWEQFPKRWLIVLLCFFSFLLCNMDRVCYFSISTNKILTFHCNHILFS